MAINFNSISPNVRATKNFIELAGVRRSLAGLFIPPTVGIIGQYDPAETGTVDYEPVKVLSSDEVGKDFGFGFPLHRMAKRLPSEIFLQGGGVWVFPVPEDSGGAAATDDLTVTGTATSNGTIYLLVGGDLVTVSVKKGDTQDAIAGKIVTAITAKRDIQVTASAVANVITLTAKFNGTQGNQIKVVFYPAGSSQSEQAPDGVSLALGNSDGYLSGGSGDPDIHDVFFDSAGDDKLTDRWYTAFNVPYMDATNIGYQVQSAEDRAAPKKNRFFANYGALVNETYANALAEPANHNTEFLSLTWENRYLATAYELAAEIVGIIADSQNLAPNRPYKTLELAGPVNNSIGNRSYTENDALFRAGMGYINIRQDGTPVLGDLALTRRTNSSGSTTEAWFDAVSMHARQAKSYSLEQLFLDPKYARGVVVDNNQITAIDYAIAPKDIVADVTKLINELWAPQAWSKNIEDVIGSLSAEINSANQSRIDADVVDDEAKALRIIAFKYGFLY